MKKLTLIIILLFVSVTAVSAQNYRVDLSVIRHITQPFFEAMADKNIEVRTTYQCGTHYRKDWQPGTYMRLSGKGFVWTDNAGVAHIDLFTLTPPMSLEGYRPPMTLNTAPVDQDGNIVIGDPQYWIRYRVWQTRPCVRFSMLLKENNGIAGAWNYWVDGRTDMNKYRDQWRELGMSDSGKMPSAYLVQEIPNTDFGTIQWSNIPNYLQPINSIGQPEMETFTWEEDKSILPYLVIGGIISLLVVLFALSKMRVKVIA